MKQVDINFLSSNYWNDKYKIGDIRWDIGAPTPIFSDWINKQNTKLNICVLGAGNGWDAVNFAKNGHEVTAVDFAQKAVNNMANLAKKEKINLKILKLDIFRLKDFYSNYFDVIVEYTCFCAIHPKDRIRYIELVNKILKPGAQLVALFFPLNVDRNKDSGPPFSIDLNEVRSEFSRYFNLISDNYHKLSIKPRENREKLLIFKKHECKNSIK
tara:strand:- start:1484 stop:2122 length:639 start_codon:yes stop_codon:yes gene_type:complete